VYIKNSEFYADFKSIKNINNNKNAHTKSYLGRQILPNSHRGGKICCNYSILKCCEEIYILGHVSTLRNFKPKSQETAHNIEKRIAKVAQKHFVRLYSSDPLSSFQQI